LDLVGEVTAVLYSGTVAHLDSEWVQQDDHKRVADVVARTYEACRRGGRDDMIDIAVYMGSALERMDMGECFAGPWDVANIAVGLLLERASIGCSAPED